MRINAWKRVWRLVDKRRGAYVLDEGKEMTRAQERDVIQEEVTAAMKRLRAQAMDRAREKSDEMSV